MCRFLNIYFYVDSRTIQVRLNEHMRLILKIMDQQQNEVQDSEQEVHFEPRYSKRGRTKNSFSLDFLTFLLENEPKSFMEAISSPQDTLWKYLTKSHLEVNRSSSRMQISKIQVDYQKENES